MAEQHCPSCGYTKADAQLHGDHRLCKNAGNAPWERKAGAARPGAAPQPHDEIGTVTAFTQEAADAIGVERGVTTPAHIVVTDAQAGAAPQPHENCVHCGQVIRWQGRYKGWENRAQGYWFSAATGSGCPKSNYGHERSVSNVVNTPTTPTPQPRAEAAPPADGLEQGALPTDPVKVLNWQLVFLRNLSCDGMISVNTVDGCMNFVRQALADEHRRVLEIAKEIRGIGKPNHVVCDEIGSKDDSLYVKMPTMSQWKSLCWKAIKLLGG